MKKTLSAIILTWFLFSFQSVNANNPNTGIDLFSSYVWRGSKFGSGPALQPYIEINTGKFSLGAWGSYCISDNEAAEADLYASYKIDLGANTSLSLSLTDYYFAGANSRWFKKSSHFIEPMINLKIGKLSLQGAYMTNAQDLYLETNFDLGSVNLFIGAGDGQYTSSGKFNICNTGISTSKEIKITDSFSLPVTGAIILNPSTEQFHVTVGISL